MKTIHSLSLGVLMTVALSIGYAQSSQPNMVGVYVDFGSAGADVGGANPADRNVFGCMSKGIDVVGNDANIYGNLIGTGAGVLLASGIVYNRAMDASVMPWAIASGARGRVAARPRAASRRRILVRVIGRSPRGIGVR